MVIGRERNQNVSIFGSNRGGIAVGQIDPAVRDPDVVDDAGNFLRRNLSSNFGVHAVAQGRYIFDACPGWRSQMKLELSTVHRWEKILAQKWENDDDREYAGGKEARDENPAMRQT